jgi:hypothetical protein
MAKEQTKAVNWVKSSNGLVEVYSNMVHLTWSLDDVRIRFAQMVPETPNPGEIFGAVAEERAAATLTWRGAKLLRDQLSIVIDNYEKVNGEIKTNIKLPSNENTQ